MSGSELFLYRSAVALSLLVYFLFDQFERRRLRDEREILIHLKSLELVQKVTLVAISGLAAIYLVWPGMNALIPILSVVLASMYTEIVGKIWFRNRL